MQVAVLTQNNDFLINGATMRLVQQLSDLGLDVVVFRTTASAKGRKTSKLATLRELYGFFGAWFTLRSLEIFLRSKVTNTKSRLEKYCAVIEVNDGVKITADLFREHCSEFNVLLIVSGTRIIPSQVLEMWAHGVLNIHSSLLPYARGLMPALWTYANNRGMGVTLFRVDEGIDTGEVICQVPVSIRPPTYLDHLRLTKKIGINLFVAWVIHVLLCGKKLQLIESSYNKYPDENFRLKDFL